MRAVAHEDCIYSKRMVYRSDDIINRMVKSQKYCMRKKGQLDVVKIRTCTHTNQARVPPIGRIVYKFSESFMHTDVCGFAQNETLGGKSYCLTVIRTLSAHLMVQLLMRQGEASQHIYDCIAYLDRSSDETAKLVFTDNAMNILSMRLTSKRSGITQSSTSAHIPESDGISWKIIRTRFDKVRVMLKRQFAECLLRETVYYEVYL